MRREWEPEDLIASWTLLPEDADMLVNKSGATRLGFALLLKFFEIEARFPRFPAEVPLLAVHFVAQQVRVDPSAWESYDWQGRSVKAHRVQIRKRFNFRECSLGDQDKLIAWLAAEVCPIEQRSDQLRDALVARCRLDQLVPPTSGQLDRIATSGMATFEQTFCSQTVLRLTTASQGMLEAMTSTADRVDLLNSLVLKISTRAERRVEGELLTDLRRVRAGWSISPRSSPRSPPASTSPEQSCNDDCCWCYTRWAPTSASGPSSMAATTGRPRPRCGGSAGCS